MKLLICILISTSLVGCGEIQGYAVNAAVEGCKDHGGVTVIYPNLHERHARCQDGTRVMHLNNGVVK